VHQQVPDCGIICTPYAVQECFTGPAQAAGKGICKKGFEQCLATGKAWSPCYDQVLPASEDLCQNNLDDDCDGTQADENCSQNQGTGVWVDYDWGNDAVGDGSFKNPWKTLNKALGTSPKLIMMKADVDGTIYPEEVNIGTVVNGITVKGWGPVKPVFQGHFQVVHCYDCVWENIEFRYPVSGALPVDPGSVVDTVHNYRNTFRNVKLSAPYGLPADRTLARTHHGYDNTWVDVEIDDVVIVPKDGNVGISLLNWGDHGSGSQFIRVRLGSNISIQGELPNQLSLTFIAVGGYCSNWPKGVSGIKNCTAGDLDLTKLTKAGSSFTAFSYSCYYPDTNPAGVMIINNTVSNINAGSVTAMTLSPAFDFQMQVSNNIIGPFSGGSSIGVSANHAVAVSYSDLFLVSSPYSGKASAGVGNISADPLFKAPDIGDFHLKPGSPCINTGDPAFSDKDGTAADMGAYGGPYAQ